MRLLMAPIKGITDYIYRDAFSRYFGGFDVAMTPFISSFKGKKIKASFMRDILPANNVRMKIIPQILSKDANDFLFLADEIFALGYQEINWNIGCPTPMVANKKRGSGLLPYPEIIEEILAKICGKFPGRISVKTRIGRNVLGEMDYLMPIFNRHPLSQLIIHPRLGVQMYKGKVNLEIFAECAKYCRHQLVYNGDITNLENFREMQNLFPMVDQWMIGRGVLMNPFLARMIRGDDDLNFSRKILLQFHDELFERYGEILAGPGHLLGRMKGIWHYYAEIFLNSQQWRKKIFKTRTVRQYRDAVKNNFEEEELVFL